MDIEKELEGIQSLLYRVAYSRLQNKEDAEDVVSDTECIVIRKYNTLKDESKFKSWVLTILVHECDRYFKNRKSNTSLYQKIIDNNNDVYDFSLDDTENRIIFENLIKNLNETDKKIFRLYFYENYTLDEISKVLDLNINTVKSRYKRSKDKIRRLLTNNSKKYLALLLIGIIFTSGIAFAVTAIINKNMNLDKYVIDYNKSQVDDVKYLFQEDKLELEIDFSEEKINKENFELNWREDSIYLINGKDIIYPKDYEWIGNDILKVNFYFGDKIIDSNLIIHLFSLNDNSSTIVLKK